MARFRAAIDIGGTFTDFVIHDLDADRVFTGKVLSTPRNPADAVIKGIEELVERPDQIDYLVHGTTVGLNALLERRGARVLLVTTDGFRDVYIIGRGDRKRLYDLHYRKPEPLLPPWNIMTVRERIRWDGTIEQPLSHRDIEAVAERARQGDIDAIAICFLHAYRNPAHELAARESLAALAPGIPVFLSHEIAREWREYERTSTVVANAYISPPLQRYLDTLERELVQRGTTGDIYIMQSNGGVMTTRVARHLPVHTLLSGPIGGVMGTRALAEYLGVSNVIGIDMGGTSFDVSIISGGEVPVASEMSLDGLPLIMSVAEIHTIGAGGGSLAWLEAGALRVGPQSAGADPGPACYGRGGTRPTVTDANLVLNRIDPDRFLGGRMRLDVAASQHALATVADELGLRVEELAEGIIDIINAKMADAIRTLAVRRGVDPREFALVAYGGAGPMHAAALADELGIVEIVVPVSPGTFSAWGMLQCDIRHDFVQTFYAPIDGMNFDAFIQTFRELEAQGIETLHNEGVEPDKMLISYSADMRYVGQEYSVPVDIPSISRPQPELISEMVAHFHDIYRRRYGHAMPEAPIEIVNLRVSACGVLPRAPVAVWSSTQADRDGEYVVAEREVIFQQEKHMASVIDRSLLQPGVVVHGPAIIEEESATTVIPPEWVARVHESGSLLLRRKGKE